MSLLPVLEAAHQIKFSEMAIYLPLNQMVPDK